MLNGIICSVIIFLEVAATHELIMHTRFTRSEEPNIWSQFTEKGLLGCISYSLHHHVEDLVPCIVLHIIQNEPNTLHALYFLYINTSSYQSFTELSRKDSSYMLRTHISLSTLIQLRGSYF